jgi:Glycosyl hydrolases family 2, TIM barrel domain
MKKIIFALSVCLIIPLIISCGKKSQTGGPAKVEIRNENGKYLVYLNNKAFTIKGAGCEFGDFATLAARGANSVRTWRIDNGRETGQQILDKAQKNGLMVLMGIEVARERHGFDYNNADSVKKQFERIKADVLKYKDHPALLAWGIGNELNLRYTNKKVWDAVNDIAKMIHQVDPNHPATTMLAGIGKDEVDYIKQNCKAIDFLCIQMYGDAINIIQRVKEAGWEGPYMVSEWGATGHWEVPSTSWKIPIEQTSSEKADAIMERWNKAISANPAKCIGNYVFIWEQKQERTPTWYGLALESGEGTEMMDVMEFNWTAKWPANRAPRLDSILLDKKTRYQNIRLKTDKQYVLQVFTHDSDNDTLKTTCEIMPDQPDLFKDGGDFELRPKPIDCKVLIDNAKGIIEFNTPSNKGPYRIYVYVHDGHNHVATANVPFFVDN